MASVDSLKREKFLLVHKELFGSLEELTREEVLEVCTKANVDWPAWLAFDPASKTSGGKYKILTNTQKPSATQEVPEADANIYEMAKERARIARERAEKQRTALPMIGAQEAAFQPLESHQTTAATFHTPTVETSIPDPAIGYVPFGHYDDVKAIIKSRIFYPMYITGLSGNGKTMMVEQIHAELGLELVRVNVTIETDEDDLLGGFRLVNGRTVWHDGPVVLAMERGATLLLDEVDLGSNKLMCLQPVLEGKNIFLKKTNRIITPAPGFNVVATANTKGKGSEDGRFIGTNVQNEAFLDRFSATFEQEYPPTITELKILANAFARHNMKEQDFVEKLVKWATEIRKAFFNQTVSELISTRRLVNIVDAYSIFVSRKKAIELCIARFDDEDKKAFRSFYSNIDESFETEKPNNKVMYSLDGTNNIRPV